MLLQFHNCFERTDWALFSQPSPEGYTCTVLHYIKTCIENVTVERQVKCYQNNKPWMNRAVKLLLKKRDKAFRPGDMELYSTARSNLKTGIKEAKAAHRRKIEGHFQRGRSPARLGESNTS